jgi:hypothetical protein
MDNAYEGVYIDDLIIGFAERGEIATNAVPNAAFTLNPQVGDNPILVGSYQVEIRRGPEYGLTQPNFVFFQGTAPIQFSVAVASLTPMIDWPTKYRSWPLPRIS